MHLRLVTPNRVLLDEEVRSVSLSTTEGEMTVLPHHVSLATLLAAGIIRYTTEKGETSEIAVSSGFIRVGKDESVYVLADTAEPGEELDLSIIEEAKVRAQKVMSQAARQDDVSFAAAAAALERDLARYRLVQKRGAKHRSVGTVESAS